MEENKDLELVKELLEKKQYTKLRQMLSDKNTADIAVILEELAEEDLLKIFRILPKTMAADVFSYLEVDHQHELITSMSEKDAAGIINNLMADDATDLLEEMPANIVKKILANANPDIRRDINHLLRYPEDSAGSIMTVEYVDLKETMTVEDAIERIRKVGMDSETINICYVLDAKRKLIGTVALRYLLISPSDAVIGEIMHEDVIFINTMMDQEEVARQFQKYDFTAMPVVDNEERLVGIITVDDIVDILQEEATEDITKMAAMSPSEQSYFETSVFSHAKHRIAWLLVLMFSATITGTIITRYEDAFAAIPLLVSFIPMLMDTGGNCGSQSATLVIRGIALNEIQFHDLFKVVFKEFRVSLIVGVALAVANGIRILIMYHDTMLALVIGCSLVITIVLSKLIGCILPLLARKVNLDPAIMASPLITTMVDTCSILVYFSIATRVFNL